MADPTRRPARKRKRARPPSDEDSSPKRKRAKATDADAPSEVSDKPSRWTSTTPWVLIAGLAVGFIAGRELTLSGVKDGSVSGDESVAAAPEGAAAVKAYASVDDFPAGWIKDKNLKTLEGLDDGQKTIALQALNERDCECGCPFGTLANCLAKDPNCPRSPVLGKHAADLVKQGKTLAEILAGIDSKQAGLGSKKPAAAAKPTGPVYIELAAWNPRKGPKHAKVTVVEFSDFQ
jgi:hypothetical protein